MAQPRPVPRRQADEREPSFKQLPHDREMYRRDFHRDYILLTVYFLDLNISYAPEAIHLSVAKYAGELGKCFNIAPSPLSTPYRTPGPNHEPDNKALSAVGLHTYQQRLGCLLFACVTCRPDLSCIVSQLAQYSRKPMANLLDLQRALQFFISTPNIGLCYSTVTTPSFNLTDHVNADHPANLDIRRSRTGFLFRLEPTGPISWKS
ncbi:unnamed protein product [Closterium sp. NIES-53]